MKITTDIDKVIIVVKVSIIYLLRSRTAWCCLRSIGRRVAGVRISWRGTSQLKTNKGYLGGRSLELKIVQNAWYSRQHYWHYQGVCFDCNDQHKRLSEIRLIRSHLAAALAKFEKFDIFVLKYSTGILTLLPDADLCRLLALGEFGMLLLGDGLAAAEDPARDFLPPGAGELVPLPPGL